MFDFDRRDRRVSRAMAAMPWTALAAAIAVMPLDALFTRVAGGFWGLLMAIVVVAAPVASVYRVAAGAASACRAIAEGVGFAFLSAALFAWVFGAPLGLAP